MAENLFNEDLDESEVEILKEQTVGVDDVPTVYEVEPKQVSTVRLEGDEWRLSYYYSQILGPSESLGMLDFNKSPTLQSYLRIVDMTILTISPISHSTDDLLLTSLTGTATVYPSVVPNKGDHFIGIISDHRPIVFVVTDVRRVKYYSTSAHEIDFNFFDFYTERFKEEFARKTVETRYFDSDNPYCLGSDATTKVNKINLASRVNQIASIWFQKFYDKDVLSVLVPNNDGVDSLYDPMVVEFMKKIAPVNLLKLYPTLTFYRPPTLEAYNRFTTVWDVLVDNEASSLGFIRQKVGKSKVSEFRSRYIFSGTGYLPVSYIIIPDDKTPLSGYGPDGEGDTYVFSQAFYDNDPVAMNGLEALTMKTLTGMSLASDELIEEISHLDAISDLKLFYRVPVLIWLADKLLY